MANELQTNGYPTPHVTVNNYFISAPTVSASSGVKKIVIEAVIVGVITIPFTVVSQILADKISQNSSTEGIKVERDSRTGTDSYEDLMTVRNTK